MEWLASVDSLLLIGMLLLAEMITDNFLIESTRKTNSQVWQWQCKLRSKLVHSRPL